MAILQNVGCFLRLLSFERYSSLEDRSDDIIHCTSGYRVEKNYKIKNISRNIGAL